MLSNWPPPGSKVALTRDISVEGERIRSGTTGKLRRYLVEKREREYPDDEFVVEVAGLTVRVERSDIRLAE